jgi:hypothetical protein
MMYSKVATYLSKQKEAGSVNLSKLSEGKTRKESARLFYEMLVCFHFCFKKFVYMKRFKRYLEFSLQG